MWTEFSRGERWVVAGRGTGLENSYILKEEKKKRA